MKKERNIKVELIRILASVLVLIFHTSVSPKGTADMDAFLLFARCVCSICVITFFVIAGFYRYKTDDIVHGWIKTIKSFFLKILLPAYFLNLFLIGFERYIVLNASIIDCIRYDILGDISGVMIEAARCFVSNKWIGCAAHLWYIYSYAMIIILWPLVCLLLKRKKKIVYTVMALILVVQVMEDWHLFYGDVLFDNVMFYLTFLHLKPVIFSIWGYLVYNDIIIKYIDNVKDKKICINKIIFWLSTVSYIIVFIIMYNVEGRYVRYGSGIYDYTDWRCVCSMILSICVILWVCNINFDYILNAYIKKVVYFLSDKTYGFYLLHFPVIVKLNSLSLKDKILRFFHLNNDSGILYLIIYNIIIYVATMIIVVIIDMCLKRVMLSLKKYKVSRK